ncbi:MAG: hypothetical protein WBV94_28520 [Blastocatellia bacterium]
MTDKRSAYDRCVAELEMAQMMLNQIASKQDAPAEDIHKAAVEAKKLEIQLAATKLAQADYHLDALKARLDFLSARVAAAGGPSKREQAELEWARTAVPINSSTVARLANELEERKQELVEMISFASKDAAA